MSKQGALRIEESDVKLHLGLAIGTLVVDNANLAIHVSSDIRTPYGKAEAHINYKGGIGDLNSIYVGVDALIVYSGGPQVSEEYALPMSVIEVSVPESASSRSPSGDIVVTMVSRWAYHSRAAAVKAYPEVTSLQEVIKEELREIGYEEEESYILQPIEELDTPTSLYRTRGIMPFIYNDVLPWCNTNDKSALYWYSTLKGTMEIRSAADMQQQDIKAFLGPAFVSYPYDEEEVIGYAYHSRSYITNPRRTELFKVEAGYHAEGALNLFTEESPIDSLETGVAVQRVRDTGDELLPLWYTGNRSLQQIQAHGRYLRRNHLFHQLHVVTIQDLHAATHCDVGSVVRLYDFELYMPESGDAPKEELTMTNMAGIYIVVASHYYFDELNEGGFTGTKLELAKLSHDPKAIADVDDLSGYMEI
ncbi:MAG: hypothetical protein LC687_04140 [Actinobacteria bacterium]|nr:hypothetical protein [Actinomycetota bacterium]MCA1807025.1 hypothetical protein [Actinomycetota bacterium]